MKNKIFFLDLIILLVIILFLLSYFKPSVILSKTITAGGDTASHYYTASYLKTQLIPDFKITGWTMGNYAGFPVLRYYFPLPFLIMTFLSYFIPLEIAFKLVTILGIFLLPIAVYIMLRLFDFEYPIPISGAIFSLPFLFNESNSMWGGNIPSTLAGEFSHSLSLSLFILFFGTLFCGIKNIKNKKILILNSILFSLIALSHIYTTFIASLSSLFLLSNNFKRRAIYMAMMYSISFILISWWIIPFAMGVPYTTAYNIRWNFNSFFEAIPQILIPFFILAVVGIISLIVKQKNFPSEKRMNNLYSQIGGNFFADKTKTLYFLSPLLLSFFFFFIANYIGLVDIRFLIMIYLWAVILAAIGIYYLILSTKKFLTRKRVSSAICPRACLRTRTQIPAHKSQRNFFVHLVKTLPLILLFIVIIFIKLNVSYIPHWIQWNYEGFESKQSWRMYKEINDFLKGDITDARVVYEHSPLHNDFGTERAFELLPLFSGRATLEGVYMQSSISSPFIFYLQSEISEKRSCPFWNKYPCTSPNLDKAARHLNLFNVKHLIARSDTIKSLLKTNPKYSLIKKIGDYEIYELKKNENRYVSPLTYEPILLQLDKFQDWKQISYNWFKDGDLDVNLAFVKKIDSIDKTNFKMIYEQKNLTSSNFFEKVKINNAKNCNVEEKIFNDEIKINTDCINKPLLIKVSYHPKWKVLGADKIYLASPSFMIIFPTENKVRLYFD